MTLQAQQVQRHRKPAMASHNCASTVGSLAAMLTSLTVTLGSSAWTCNSRGLNTGVTLATLGSFIAVNALQSKIPANMIVPLNLVVAMFPQIVFVINELKSCRQYGMTVVTARQKLMQRMQVLTVIMLPLMVYFIAGSTKLHDSVCSTLHKLEYNAGPMPAPRVNANKFDTAKILAAAREAQAKAKQYLSNAAN